MIPSPSDFASDALRRPRKPAATDEVAVERRWGVETVVRLKRGGHTLATIAASPQASGQALASVCPILPVVAGAATTVWSLRRMEQSRA